MKKRARRNHSPVFKAKVALAAIKGEPYTTLVQLSEILFKEPEPPFASTIRMPHLNLICGPLGLL
jgi:hypothetical protein